MPKTIIILKIFVTNEAILNLLSFFIYIHRIGVLNFIFVWLVRDYCYYFKVIDYTDFLITKVYDFSDL